jgi:hypothetical protein
MTASAIPLSAKYRLLTLDHIDGQTDAARPAARS